MALLAIRMAGYQPARSVHTRALHRLAERLRQELGGAADIVVTDNVTTAGRRAADLLAMTEGGELDICYFSSSYLAARVPSLGLFDRPFGFEDREAAHAAMDGAAGRRLAEDLARATNLRVLAFWDNGLRHISNRLRPIRTPADCRGLRIRTLDNALHQAFFRRLGFEPVFLDVRDLPRAIADGRVDAQENPLTNVVNFGMQAHHRFVSLTGHLFGAALLLANGARLSAWPRPLREAVRGIAVDITAAQRSDAIAEDAACHEQLLAEGVQILGPDDIDRAAFRRAAH
jgi:TRAP-type C4-dicarboxylate transport system substrate-binding protein